MSLEYQRFRVQQMAREDKAESARKFRAWDDQMNQKSMVWAASVGGAIVAIVAAIFFFLRR